MTRFFYTLLLILALPVIPLRVLWRSFRQPEYLRNLGERFGAYRSTRTQPVIWIHAVSVGETRAAQPIVEALLNAYPAGRLLLTNMTPTGRETAIALFGDRVLHAYLPYDYPWAVQRFLAHFSPCLGIIMETELWFNLLAECKRQTISVALVNARLSEKSASGYARFAALAREALQSFAFVAAQTRDDAVRLRALGAERVEVCGNLKFDITPDAALAGTGRRWRVAHASKRRVLLAASTREGEEALILDAWRGTGKPRRGTDLLVIVPRHPQRFDAVAALIAASGLSLARRSRDEFPQTSTDVWLGDSLGEMTAWYAFCDVAFIGGSLLPFGAHNLIEACSLGRPVLIGPHVFNFAEAAAQAIARGAAQTVEDANALLESALALIDNEAEMRRRGAAALEFAAENRGATLRILALLAPLLDPRSTTRLMQGAP